MSLNLIGVLILSLFEFGIFFEEILKSELGLPVVSEVPSNADKKFFLAVSLEVIDIGGDKPKMDVFDVVVIHLVFNELSNVQFVCLASK